MNNLDITLEINEIIIKLYDYCISKTNCQCEKCIFYIDNECKLDRLNYLINSLKIE